MNIKTANSGVSTAIFQTQKECRVIETQKQNEFTIKVANCLEEREAVFNLGYKIYKEKGYIKENATQWLVDKYDACRDTLILMVQDNQKKLVGSATLVFDNSFALPSEKIYQDEIKLLKKSNNKIAELSRLIISKENRYSKEILVLLFNYAAIYIQLVKEFNCLVVQVNPRHKEYYKSLLSFEEIGKEKQCPSVLNAPAHLLFLTTKKYQAEMLRLNLSTYTEKKEKSLYKYFLKSEQESLVAYYLENQTRSISLEEKIYFGLSESQKGFAVCK